MQTDTKRRAGLEFVSADAVAVEAAYRILTKRDRHETYAVANAGGYDIRQHRFDWLTQRQGLLFDDDVTELRWLAKALGREDVTIVRDALEVA